MTNATARYCGWCRRTTWTCRPVRIIHQNTGPGWTLWACQSCRSVFRLSVQADVSE